MVQVCFVSIRKLAQGRPLDALGIANEARSIAAISGSWLSQVPSSVVLLFV